MIDCDLCPHYGTCKNVKQTVCGIPTPPLAELSAKPACWVCYTCHYLTLASKDAKKCDKCQSKKEDLKMKTLFTQIREHLDSLESRAEQSESYNDDELFDKSTMQDIAIILRNLSAIQCKMLKNIDLN